MVTGKIIEINLDEIDWKTFSSDLEDEDKKRIEKFLKNKKDMQIEICEDYDDNGDVIKYENWKNITLDIRKINRKSFLDLKDVSIPFCDVNQFTEMKDGIEGYLNSYGELNYFAYRYHKINGYHPYIYRFEQFNINSFLNNLFKYIKVPASSYTKVSYQSNNDIKLSSFLIAFKKDLLLYVDSPGRGAIYYNNKDEEDKNSFLYMLLGLLRNARTIKHTKNKIYIVHRNLHSFEKTGFTINKKNINLEENYNEGFVEVSQKIINGLNDKNKTNLVILSGEPGVGKTSFIRYLATKLKKNIIFISPDMVDSITDPAFIPFLMSNNNSILIIEDAEPALEKRDQGGRSSAVSNVLNLTDGLLSDCLKISIVATFNTTKEKNIDDALTRKGRLLMSYKFEKLCAEKSQVLLKKLGYDVEVKEPMTLADIYFYGTDNNVKRQSNKIGF